MVVQLHMGEVHLELPPLVLDTMHLPGEALFMKLRGIRAMMLPELLQAMITPGVAALNLPRVLLLATRFLEEVRDMMLLVKELGDLKYPQLLEMFLVLMDHPMDQLRHHHPMGQLKHRRPTDQPRRPTLTDQPRRPTLTHQPRHQTLTHQFRHHP